MMRTTRTMMLAGGLVLAAPLGARADTRKVDETKKVDVAQRVQDTTFQYVSRELALDPMTGAHYREVADRFSTKIGEIQKESGLRVRELKVELASKSPNDQHLTALLDQISSYAQQLRELDAKKSDELRHVLTPMQYAKLIVTWPLINKKIRDDMLAAYEQSAQPYEVPKKR